MVETFSAVTDGYHLRKHFTKKFHIFQNYHLLLQLILLSLGGNCIQSIPVDTLDNEIPNDIFIELDASSPNDWNFKKHFYQHPNAAEEPFDFVITTDLETPIASTPSKDVVYLENEQNGRISIDDDIKLDEEQQTIKSIPPTTISTTTTSTTTTQKPKNTGFWQSVKSIICNDFDFTKAAQESGSPLQPISDAIEDVQRSETWKQVNTYAGKTKDVIVETLDDVQRSDTWKEVNSYAGKTKDALVKSIDDLGDKLKKTWNGGFSDWRKKFNI